MSNVFDTAFASAKALYESRMADQSVQIDFTMTLLEKNTNKATYSNGSLTYTPGTGTGIEFGTPASFTNAGLIHELFSTNQGSDGGPFDPTQVDPLNVTITASEVVIPTIPHATISTLYEVTLVFNAGEKNPITVRFAPSFDSTSSLAYGALPALDNSPLATISLTGANITAAPPK
jgi:hypothetical protein